MFKLCMIFIPFFLTSHLSAKAIIAEDLFSNADYSMVQMSPEGTYISAHYINDRDHYLSIIDIDKSEIIHSVRLGLDITLNSYEWINEKYIYFNVTYENKKILFIATLKGNDVSLSLIKTSGYLVHTMPEQEDVLMFAKQKSTRSRYHHLYLIDIESFVNDDFSQAKKIEYDSNYIAAYVYDEQFERILTAQYDTDKRTVSIKYIPLEGGRWKTIFIQKNEDYYIMPQGFINEEVLWVLTNKDTDKIVLREYSIKDRTLGDVLYEHPKYDLLSGGFTDDGKLDYVTYFQYGLVKKLYFETEKSNFQNRLSNTFIKQEAYIVDSDADKNLYLLYLNGANEPGQYYTYDKSKDLINRLLVSFPKLSNLKFSETEQLSIKSKDGVVIEAFLTLPQDLNFSTLLVMPHGGPISIQDRDRFNKQVQYYSSRGFSVLRMNFRGSFGFGKDFLKQGVGEFGKLIEEDISAVVKEVRKKYKFKSMCSIGASYGGYSAVMLAIKYPGLYDCVVASFGIYDLPLLFNTSNFRSGEKYHDFIAKTVGDFDNDMQAYSPVYISDKFKAPLLLIGGRDDKVADFEHTNRFNYVLNQNNHKVETIFYKNTAHGHNKWAGDIHETAATSDFIIRTLGLIRPKPDSLDNYSKRAWADDFVKIADEYTFSKLIEEDRKTAISYYKKAATYDNPRANFQMGSYYHKGEQVEVSIERAVEYYKKSADLGYSRAHARLGRMYMEGEYFSINWDKALHHLTKAFEFEDSPLNQIRLARLYCIAPKENKDVKRCLNLMSLEQFDNRSKWHLNRAETLIRTTLGWVFSEAKLTKEEHEEVLEFTKTAFKLKETYVTLEVVDEGTFKYVENEKFGKKGRHQNLTKGRYIIPSDDDLRFGIFFNLDVMGINRAIDQTAIAVRWILTKDDASKTYFNTTLLYGSPTRRWSMLYPTKNAKQNEVWTLELYDLNQNRLYQGDFKVSETHSTIAE